MNVDNPLKNTVGITDDIRRGNPNVNILKGDAEKNTIRISDSIPKKHYRYF
jgi:hypothetical protein